MASVLALALAVAYSTEESCGEGCAEVSLRVSSIDPPSGSLRGGTRLLVNGVGFRDFGSLMRCRFGLLEVAASLSARPGEWMNPHNHTQISCESPNPQRADEHSADFALSLNGEDWTGGADGDLRFEYVRMPVLLALSPERVSAARPGMLTLTRDTSVHTAAWSTDAAGALCKFEFGGGASTGGGGGSSSGAGRATFETAATVVDDSEVVCSSPLRTTLGAATVELSLNYGRDYTSNQLVLSLEDHWHKRGTVGGGPSAREACTVASSNGRLYVVGGIESRGTFLNDMFTLHAYQPTALWQSLTLMLDGETPAPLGGRGTLSAWGANLIHFGGVSDFTGNGASNLVHQFHVHSERWQALGVAGEAIPARESHTALVCTASEGCSVGDGRPALFIYGGLGLADCANGHQCLTLFDDLWALDLNSMHWTQKIAPSGPDAHGGAAHGGGGDDASANATVAPPARKGHVAALFNGSKMLVWGGAAWIPDPNADNSYGATQRHANDLWHLDLESLVWEETAFVGTPPSPREGAASAMIDQRYLVVHGGYAHGAADGGFLQDTHILDTGRWPMAWAQPVLSGTPPSARHGHKAVVVDQPEDQRVDGRHEIYLFGGSGRSGYHGDVFVLQLDTQELETFYSDL